MNLKTNSDYLHNRLVLVMVTECVYCEVETDEEKCIQINFILQTTNKVTQTFDTTGYQSCGS
jgi:hypothetical protein